MWGPDGIKTYHNLALLISPRFLYLRFVFSFKLFWCWNGDIPGELDQHHGCWCPGPMRHQVVSSLGFEYAGFIGLCLPWDMISTRCAISVLKDDGKDIDGLTQEIHNSIANALELRLSCINPSKYWGFLKMISAECWKTQEFCHDFHDPCTVCLSLCWLLYRPTAICRGPDMSAVSYRCLWCLVRPGGGHTDTSSRGTSKLCSITIIFVKKFHIRHLLA